MSGLSAVHSFVVSQKDLIAAMSGAASLTLLLVKQWPKFVARCREYFRRYQLATKLQKSDYTQYDIERAVTYYVDPDCQVVDPSGGEDFRRVYPVRQNVFSVVDDLLVNKSTSKYTLLLADTGMGKTSFLLNYYARHWQNRVQRKKFEIALVPLSSAQSDRKIKAIPQKENTVLFLDALDEDTSADRDHKKRFRELVALSNSFRHVLITCRTQFFAQDDEIPRETGIIKIGPIAQGDTREYVINKLYLSPFSEKQIKKYLSRRFPFWQTKKRKTAFEVVKKIEDLSARPMLMAQIEHILMLGEECKYSFQIYEQMIQSWLNRERGIAEPRALREFCECLAVDLMEHRKERGAEKIAVSELAPLAKRFDIELPRVEHIRTRSLLNRDAQGNLKFAHRSIMEYLFIARFLKYPESTPKLQWTDQMKRFYWENSYQAWERFNTPVMLRDDADLNGLEHLQIKPVLVLRSEKTVMEHRGASNLQAIAQMNNSRVQRAPHFYRRIEIPPIGDRIQPALSSFRAQEEVGTGSPEFDRIVFRTSTQLRNQGLTIVFDHALGLAWEIPGEETGTRLNLTFIREHFFSKLRIAGFSRWRLPTVEEVFSLAHLASCEAYRGIFKHAGTRIWTSDQIGLQHVSVDLQNLDIRAEGLSQASGLWPRVVCVASLT